MNYIITLILIFCSGYYYSTMDNASTISIGLIWIGSAILLWKSIKSHKIHMKKNAAIFSLFYIIVVVFTSFVNFNIGLICIKQVSFIVFTLLITNFYEWKKFKDSYIKVMLLIVIFAFLGYLIGNSNIVNMLPTIVNANGVKYISAIFFTIIQYDYGIISERMQGLFWEPGLLTTYSIIAILFLSKKDYSLKKYYLYLCIFIAAIILSKSGAGLTLLPITIINKWLQDKNDIAKTSMKILILFLIALSIAFTSIGDRLIDNTWLNTYLFSKITNEENISSKARIDSVKNDMEIAYNNLPFGVSIDMYASESSKSSFDSSGTSTLTIYIASYGILGVLLVILLIKSLIILSKSLNCNFFGFISTFFIFIMILSKEPHVGLLLMNCLFVYPFTGMCQTKGRRYIGK